MTVFTITISAKAKYLSVISFQVKTKVATEVVMYWNHNLRKCEAAVFLLSMLIKRTRHVLMWM